MLKGQKKHIDKEQGKTKHPHCILTVSLLYPLCTPLYLTVPPHCTLSVPSLYPHCTFTVPSCIPTVSPHYPHALVIEVIYVPFRILAVEISGLHSEHWSTPRWFIWSLCRKQGTNPFSSGKAFPISGNSSFKRTYSNGLKQIPFLVGITSSSGFQYCLISTHTLLSATVQYTFPPMWLP